MNPDNLRMFYINRNSRYSEVVRAFLDGFLMTYELNIDYTLLVYDKDLLIGTCSYEGRVIKCFAVMSEYRNSGIGSKIITSILNRQFDDGLYDVFAFSTHCNKELFISLGFAVVHYTSDIILFEKSRVGIKDYLNQKAELCKFDDKPKAAIVMNCNPFTLGHLHLIETASKRSKEVIVFIVEEDKSEFPFEVRFKMVRNGVKHLKNVKLLPGSRYIVSSNTFPSYFVKDKSIKNNMYGELDALIFCRYIARRFNIRKRYVGTEPNCELTRVYNSILKRVLADYNIDLEICNRLLVESKPVSASMVRKLLVEGELEATRKYLPETTFNFLKSEAGGVIIKKIVKDAEFSE